MKKINKKKIYFVLFCLILCFIWGNSLLSREISGAMSHFVADILGGGGASKGGHYLLRKAAHFSEFAALGCVFFLLAKEVWSNIAIRLSLCGLVGISVPLIDETLQIFSDRGHAISDVWIDIAGYAMGSLLTCLVIFIFSRRMAEKKQS